MAAVGMSAGVALKQSTTLKSDFCGTAVVNQSTPAAKSMNVVFALRAAGYDEELVKTANTIASKGRGILAMDECNATCGKRLASIGLENTEANRQAFRQLLVTTPGLGEYISGAILFEETLYPRAGRRLHPEDVEATCAPSYARHHGQPNITEFLT